MRTLLCVLVVISVVAAMEERAAPVPPPVTNPPPDYSFCSTYPGYRSEAPDPPVEEDMSWEDTTFYSSVYAEGLVPATVDKFQPLVCDMFNTMLWKADTDMIMVLGMDSARTRFREFVYGNEDFGEFQIMTTKCVFDHSTGFYLQYLVDELTSEQIWVQRFSYMDMGFENTWVLMEAWYSPDTIESLESFFENTEEYVMGALQNNTDVEFSRLFTLATSAPMCPMPPPYPPPFDEDDFFN